MLDRRVRRREGRFRRLQGGGFSSPRSSFRSRRPFTSVTGKIDGGGHSLPPPSLPSSTSPLLPPSPPSSRASSSLLPPSSPPPNKHRQAIEKGKILPPSLPPRSNPGRLRPGESDAADRGGGGGDGEGLRWCVRGLGCGGCLLVWNCDVLL